MKACRKCGIRRALSAFYKHAGMKDGHLNICKDCTKLRIRKYGKRPEVRKWDRERRRGVVRSQKTDRTRRNEQGKRWSKDNLHKRKAHGKVSAALKGGKIERPNMCSECLTTCKPEAHHPDYNKLLDVVWLCTKCHAKKHWKE